MALVAVVALEFSSMRLAGGAGVDVCRFLTVATLVWGSILARVRGGRVGAFWFGFALAGWASYLLVVDALAARSSDSVVSLVPLWMVEATVDRAGLGNSFSAHNQLVDQIHMVHYKGGRASPAGQIGSTLTEGAILASASNLRTVPVWRCLCSADTDMDRASRPTYRRAFGACRVGLAQTAAVV
jgi:hypothetical protein